jgi:hypothetical protein
MATAALTVLAAPFLALVAPAGVARTTADSGPLHVIGKLPQPPASQRTGPGTVAGFDVAARRMYYVYQDKAAIAHVVTYDLRPRIPKPIATGTLLPMVSVLSPTPYTVAVDSRRKQLAFITGNIDVAGNTVVLGNPSLTVYSDVTHKVGARWDLAQTVPGFYPFGITYSPADDRYYLIGEFSAVTYGATSTATFNSKAVGPGTAVLSLDPATGKVNWLRPVPECQQALYSFNIGGLISRSSAQDALYFACVTGGTSVGKATYPGEAGLVRLHIGPKDADSVTATQRPLDFFAISGNYFNGALSGIAAFDHTTDRFYLQSLAPQTPGAWVFDGRLSAWVGFVSAPSPQDQYIGLNERLGHLYIGTFSGGGKPAKTDGILVADVRQTPVPAGEFQQIVAGAPIATDAGSNRLFVRPYNAGSTMEPYNVVEDLSQVTNGVATVDYDADTTNTPDAPPNDISYALGAAGYGAQSIQVGGTGGAGSIVGTPDIPGVAQGTRAVMSARLGGLDLRASGAGASTQAALADINTVQHYEGTNGAWPYPTTSCLDTGGEPVNPSYKDGGATQPANGGTSSVSCDLGKATVSASARMGASGAGATTVHKSSYDATATRDTRTGAVVTTTAMAEGVTFDVAGGIKVSIGRTRATSKAMAHGRPGTTLASWTRDVEGVRITDQTGTTIFTAPGCSSAVVVGSLAGKRTSSDTCGALADTVNKVLPTRFHISFPMPNVQATPKGAYAAVEQTEADYYQQRVVNDQGVIYRGDSVGPRPVPAVVTEVYTDSTERSRTVTVLAATQSNAIFTIVPPFDFGSGGDGGTSGGDSGTPGTPGTPGGPGIVSGSTGGGTGTGSGQPQTIGNGGSTASGPATNVTGYLFMRRSLRDTALLILLAGLMFSGAVTAWRRRRLVDVLVTVPRKDAV